MQPFLKVLIWPMEQNYYPWRSNMTYEPQDSQCPGLQMRKVGKHRSGKAWSSNPNSTIAARSHILSPTVCDHTDFTHSYLLKIEIGDLLIVTWKKEYVPQCTGHRKAYCMIFNNSNKVELCLQELLMRTNPSLMTRGIVFSNYSSTQLKSWKMEL